MSSEVQYWDSGLFINLITNKDPAKVSAITEMWRSAQRGNAIIAVSNFVLVEVRPKQGFEKDYQQVVSEMLEASWPFVHWYAVSREIALEARKLAVDHPRLTPPDTIHLATALQAEASVFLTYDGLHENKHNRRTKDLLAYDGKIGKEGMAALRIEVPRHGYGTMFDQGPRATPTV